MSPSADTYAELVQRGEELVAEGKPEEAIKAFCQATEIDPNQFWAVYRLGVAYFRLQRWEQAVESFQRANALRSDHFWSHFKLGEAQAKLERWSEAIDAYSAARKIQPDSFAANFSLAKACFHAQRWTDAVASFVQANRFDSNDFWSQFHLGESLSKLERWEEAVAAFERADKLKIDLSPIHRELTNQLIKQRCGGDQIASYELAIVTRPDDFSLHFCLGLTLLGNEEYKTAVDSFRKSIELNPTFCSAYEQLGQAYLKLNQFQGAEESYRKAIEISASAQGWTMLGEILLMQNRTGDSIAALIQAIARERSHTPAYALLGTALERDGRPADAIAVYQQAKYKGVTNEEIERRLAVAEEQDSAARSGEQVGESADTTSPDSNDRSDEMLDSNRPLLFVVCNDYGELALVMYLLEGQSFAPNATLMLPPRLHANNPDILPGRTLVYHSAVDIRQEIGKRPRGILGLFSGYLLPTHHLCASGELDSLLRWAHSEGWQAFTSDPFLGLVDGGEERRELVSRRSGNKQSLEDLFIHLLTETHATLKRIPHVYPFGVPPLKLARSVRKHLCFHNPAFLSPSGKNPPALSAAPTAAQASPRWLFVLGSEDYSAQKRLLSEEQFCRTLVRMLEETLAAGCTPTLIAPVEVIDSVRKQSPLASEMELLPHCEYFRFLSLLRDAEYVFYWNAVSFSALLRTLLGKPWFTFDNGHLINTMSAEYVARISEWFYQGCEPPRLAMTDALTCETLQQATSEYEGPARRIRETLLASLDPQSLLSALARKSDAIT